MESNNINLFSDYLTLLERLYSHINEKRGDSESLFLKSPIAFSKGKKTIWMNFGTICEMLHRPYDHVMFFIFSEFGCMGGLDTTDSKNVKLNINSKFTSKNLENVLRNYIANYVKCKACKSPDTIFSNDKKIMICNHCNTEHFISPMNQGFKAVTKQTRKNKLNIMD